MQSMLRTSTASSVHITWNSLILFLFVIFLLFIVSVIVIVDIFFFFIIVVYVIFAVTILFIGLIKLRFTVLFRPVLFHLFILAVRPQFLTQRIHFIKHFIKQRIQVLPFLTAEYIFRLVTVIALNGRKGDLERIVVGVNSY
ncbi:hypothetical protein CPB84DRAFT_165270 [Gymnopilus junonius]|uniref:Uncharacterized protein n=1 Tax=Gymnopilus junonius TaxID=109634 RepID=A0A9P5NVY7_GYMJU|nr:hypothetical protein CPB84DRAFT_165270 [Gymnopilus junonius]